MRILLVNTFYYPHMQGGAEHSVKILAEGLAKRGHEVYVFTIDSEMRGKDANGVETIGGVKVVRNSGGKFQLYRFCYQKGETSKIWKARQKLYYYFNRYIEQRFEMALDELKPDVVHTNSLSGIPKTIWEIAEEKGIPVVHTVRDTLPISPYVYGHRENKTIVAIHRAYGRRYSKYVSAVTAPSEYTLETSLATGWFSAAKIKRRVFNCVKYDDERLKRLIDEKSRRSGSRIKFMYAGRLVSIKGIAQLLKAFSEMREECELHICGTGELKPDIERAASADKRINFHGRLSSDRLQEMYEQCDVLIVPSCWPEPFGRVVIEGNASALPVIAADRGGIPEILEITKCGKLYDADSSLELLSCMKTYLSREKIGESLQHLGDGRLSAFSADKQLNSFLEIYQMCKFQNAR